jgi:hypothetical protein
VSLRDFGAGLESVHDRHGKIHNNYVGLEPLDSFNRLNTIAGLTAYLPFGLLLQQPAQQLTDGCVIVGD